LIEERAKRLEEVRARAQEVKEQIAAKVEGCDELDRRVGDLEEELKTLETQLERLKPKSRQVDKNYNEDWLWKR
jgi:uncharacterized coiled-coil DUF342 family protein|tara:strand:+ start:159 stop:380 length:222 start_codon:yes stop_codon:yes gene_type:complete